MNFKKVLAGACAGTMVLGMCAVPVFAEETETATYEIVSNDTLYFNVEELKETAVETITFDFDFSNEGSYGGGSVGYNTCLEDGSYDKWEQQDWSNDGTTSVTIAVDDLFFESADDPQNIQVQVWWQSGGDGVPVVLNVTKTYAEEEPSEEDPVVDETIAVETTGAGQLRAENDVYRVNIYNSWTNDENDCIVDPAFTADAASVNVTFTVTGLTAAGKSGNIGINFANSAWDTQYWDLAADESGVFDVNALNITEDGTYTVSIGKADKSALGALAFMDLQTDIKVNADEKDLDITSGIVITIDEISIVKAEANEEPVEDPSEEEPSEEQPSEEQPSEADPSDNDVPSTPSNPDGDVAPVAGLAVVAVAALGAAVVCLKKKENA